MQLSHSTQQQQQQLQLTNPVVVARSSTTTPAPPRAPPPLPQTVTTQRRQRDSGWTSHEELPIAGLPSASLRKILTGADISKEPDELASSSSSTPLKQTPQSFKETAGPQVSVPEGESILLKCIVLNLQGTAQWTKNDQLIYDQLVSNQDYFDKQHYAVNGTTQDNPADFSLDLRNARLDDTAQYTCLIRANNDGEDGKKSTRLVARTNLTVIARETIQRPNLVDNNELANSRSLASTIIDSKQRARDVLGNLPKLGPQNSHLQTTSGGGGAASAGFIPAMGAPSSLAIPSPSSQQFQVNHGLSAQASSGQTTTTIRYSSWLLLWPYLLLVLAGLLLMTNIYLICSLIQRHRRAQAHRRRRQSNQAGDGSLESGSNAGCSSTSNLGDENDSQARLKNLGR